MHPRKEVQVPMTESEPDYVKYPKRHAMCDGGSVYSKEKMANDAVDMIGEYYNKDVPPEQWSDDKNWTVEECGGCNDCEGVCEPVFSIPESTEKRYVDPVTGGQKGQKLEEYAYIPAHPLAEVARVYGMGAKKYEPWNWSKGYPWSLSYSALFRHIEAHRRGESLDPDSGLSHLAHAAFHLFTLMEFDRAGLGTDDRWKE